MYRKLKQNAAADSRPCLSRVPLATTLEDDPRCNAPWVVHLDSGGQLVVCQRCGAWGAVQPRYLLQPCCGPEVLAGRVSEGRRKVRRSIRAKRRHPEHEEVCLEALAPRIWRDQVEKCHEGFLENGMVDEGARVRQASTPSVPAGAVGGRTTLDAADAEELETLDEGDLDFDQFLAEVGDENGSPW